MAIQSNKIKYCSIKDGTLFLKRNDNYYYQVQGQLHISQNTYCYFCVRTPKGKHKLLKLYIYLKYIYTKKKLIITGLMYEKIKRDEETMIYGKITWKPKLKRFI